MFEDVPVTYITFVGDIHGMHHFIPQGLLNPVVQVGDMDLGFQIYDLGKGCIPETPISFGHDFHFIRGNHDNPAECRKHEQYLGEFGFNERLGIFFVGGGFSTDRGRRTMGIDYWDDEELTHTQINEMLQLYNKLKPKIVVTHEAPASIVADHRGLDDYQPSRTALALDAMLDVHRPKRWVFGHHHRHLGFMIKGTHFIGLDIGEVFHLDVRH